MRIPKYLIAILVLFFYVNIISIEPAFDSSSKSKPKLEDILKKCAEYCEKIEGSALFFICQEKIKEEFTRLSEGMMSAVVTSSSGGQRSVRIRRMPGSIEKNEYVYDYQLVKKGSQIRESRTLIEENGEKRNIKDAPLKTKRFYSLRSVLGPVGFLGKEFQELYSYKLKKEGKFKGRKAYIIEVIPKRKMEDKPNYGKLWVDKENFSVLKSEISQESLAGYEDLEKKQRVSASSPF